MDYKQLAGATIEFNYLQNDQEQDPYGNDHGYGQLSVSVSEKYIKDESILDECQLMTWDECLQILQLDDEYYCPPPPPPQQPTFQDINDLDTWYWNSILSISSDLDAVEPAAAGVGATLLQINEEESTTSRKKPKSSGLELEEIQKYFHFPITKAAKQLRVGVTVLKKRCRELNITRWPHRKLKSLNTLIHNIKELGISRNKMEVEKILEEQIRAVEKVPGLHLTPGTKKLRQACFKANYKKRRLARPSLGDHASSLMNQT